MKNVLIQFSKKRIVYLTQREFCIGPIILVEKSVTFFEPCELICDDTSSCGRSANTMNFKCFSFDVSFSYPPSFFSHLCPGLNVISDLFQFKFLKPLLPSQFLFAENCQSNINLSKKVKVDQLNKSENSSL